MLHACRKLSSKRTFLRNHEIFFDKVRVVDKNGIFVSEMTTIDAIALANSKKKDLFMVDYDSLPICRFAKSVNELGTKEKLDPNLAYSFDPTARPATIQMSANIASEELEMKLDILRKHLLLKKRCEVVIKNRDIDADVQGELISRIIKEVDDIAKLASDLEEDHTNGDVRFKLWPCKPEQTISN